ncbi:MAG: hypothetical protein M9890_14500 [Thermomicrobiales bacterium]|nr:hypothetical protein [Thermomicrobiales bacterium]
MSRRQIRAAIMVVGVLLALVLLVAIAASVTGPARIILLALLAPVLVFTVLLVWRSLSVTGAQEARRQVMVASLQRDGIVGVLAWPPAPRWDERIHRTFILPAGRHLLVLDQRTEATPTGGRARAALEALLGPLDGPERAVLALVEADGAVHGWDISAILRRVDAGDAAADRELSELAALVQQRALSYLTNLT